MNKIPSVFLRNPEDMNHLLKTPHPDALWVLAGEGVATRKYDGVCVMLDEDGQWWGRKEIKKGKSAPPNWIPVEEDDYTGRIFGWEPIEQSSFVAFWRHAIIDREFAAGTYELCAPRIGRNPERLELPRLFKHSAAETIHSLTPPPYDYEALKSFVMYVHDWMHWEGIVWHHPDGRMAKLKGRDFK